MYNYLKLNLYTGNRINSTSNGECKNQQKHRHQLPLFSAATYPIIILVSTATWLIIIHVRSFHTVFMKELVSEFTPIINIYKFVFTYHACPWQRHWHFYSTASVQRTPTHTWRLCARACNITIK